MVCPCSAVVWHDGQPLFLNSVVGRDWDLTAGLRINDRGEIVAQGQFRGGPFQMVLMKPIKEGQVVGEPVTQLSSVRGTGTSYLRGLRRERSGNLSILP